jgi:hypothetical protein
MGSHSVYIKSYQFKILISSLKSIQRYQSKLLRLKTNAPWFVTNETLHQDLCIAEVRTVFREKAIAHHKTLSEHPNPLMGPLTDQQKGNCSPQNIV